jgi:hypothetical protein
MNLPFVKSSFGALITLVALLIATPASVARAQESAIVTTPGRQIVRVLGRDAAEFGGGAVAQQTAKRLISEAAESGGAAGSLVAKAQVERIVASGDKSLVFDLKSLRGTSVVMLKDVTDEGLVSAVGTLTRPGVSRAIESLGSSALQRAALAGETRLPGVGLKLVQHYGDDGARLVSKLTEDQANSVVAALRPNAINSLPAAERSSFLNALSSRPDARVFNLGGTAGPLVIVASGLVIWHGVDVTLAPDERVTERPDGTVIREKTSVGSRAVGTVPAALRELSTPLKWSGVTLALGATLLATTLLWRRQSRKQRPQNA